MDIQEENLAALQTHPICTRCQERRSSIVVRNRAGDVVEVVCGYCMAGGDRVQRRAFVFGPGQQAGRTPAMAPHEIKAILDARSASRWDKGE
jgi:hypothetical protein